MLFRRNDWKTMVSEGGNVGTYCVLLLRAGTISAENRCQMMDIQDEAVNTT
jgi:hypothetical protein